MIDMARKYESLLHSTHKSWGTEGKNKKVGAIYRQVGALRMWVQRVGESCMIHCALGFAKKLIGGNEIAVWFAETVSMQFIWGPEQ